MTDARQFKDSEGDFTEWEKIDHLCPKCGHQDLHKRTWKSHCGGYEDYQFECRSCHNSYWIDGIDS
jgi:ssDNA-binding Zn-finger/Zn-ribbon topoisomerase 1